MPRASEAAPGVSRVGAVAPCKGKSFTPYRQGAQNWHQSLLLLPDEDFKSTFNAFALSGRDCTNTGNPGCRFACPGLCTPLGFQPAFAKSETSVPYSTKLIKLFFTIKWQFCPTTCQRTPSRVQPSLLPETNASAPRFERRSSQRRTRLLPDSQTSIEFELTGIGFESTG